MFMNTNLWRGLTSLMAFLLVFTILGNQAAMSYDGVINNFLGVKTVEVIEPETSVKEDTQYYKSSYGDFTPDNLKRLVEDSFDQTIQEMIEGAVLLKNDNDALPLDKASERISFFGHASVDPIYKGNSAGVDPMPGYRINFPTALRMDGFTLNEELVEALSASSTTRAKSNYFWMDCTNATNGIADGEDPISFYTPEIRSTWENAQGGTAIMVLTRCGQENFDMLVNNVTGFVKGEGMFDPPISTGTPTGLSSLALIQEERDILAMLKEAKDAGYFSKIIVLLNTGNTMEVGWLDEYGVDACVYTGLLGGVGAHGVAKLLAGEANFSGRSVDTYAVNSLSSPAVVNANGNSQVYLNGDEVEAAVIGTISPFADTGRYMNFQGEGIYVGYKYYETRYEDCVLDRGHADGANGASNGASQWKYEDEVSYTFGRGLSYTTFEEKLDSVSYDQDRDVYEVTVTVTNTGNVAGKRTVMVYAQTPYGDYEMKNRVEKSAVSFVGFEKTGMLEPGASQTVKVEVERYLLASYDYTAAKTYILSEGDYYLAVGDDAHDALNNILAAKQADPARMTAAGDAAKVYAFHGEFDAETYSTTQTGAKVTNRFDDADLNYWVPGAGVYLTRSDWNGTFPVPTTVTATPEMIRELAGHNYTKPEGALSVKEATADFGKDAGLRMVDMMNVPYEDEETWNLFIKQMTLDEMLNVLDDAQGNQWAVSEALGLTPLSLGDGVDGPNAVTIEMPYEDTEGKYGSGLAERVSMCCFTGKAILTGTFNRELYAARGRFIGEYGLWGNKQLFWTLGANYHRTPFSGRNFEYCSEDANLCYMALVPEAIEIEKYGVICCAKHPAGNDQEFTRIGISSFFNEQAWREGSLRACEGAFRKADIQGYMQSYLRIGLVSTMRSDAFNNGVVRTEWGFQGAAITDCTNAREDGYQGDYIDQLAAGTDCFCMTNAQIAKQKVLDYLNATNDGDYVQYILRAAKNYCFQMSRSNMVNGMSSNTIIRHLTPWWQTALTSAIICFAVLTALSAVMLTVSKIKARKH